MKIWIQLLAALLILSTGLQAQNLVYDANAEVRKVDPFTGVDIGGGINVYISQGKQQAVAVSADDAKFVSKIITEVKNGVLKIHLESGLWNKWNWGNKKIKAYITVTELNSLELGGGSVGKLTDPVSVVDLKVSLSGGSILTGKFTGTNLKLDLSGGSIANLDGNFTSTGIDASGGSILKAFDAVFNTCKAEASGGSIININISKELSAEASGGSIIHYKGDGVIRNINTSGGSIIKKS